jgi:hypothetical protein
MGRGKRDERETNKTSWCISSDDDSKCDAFEGTAQSERQYHSVTPRTDQSHEYCRRLLTHASELQAVNCEVSGGRAALVTAELVPFNCSCIMACLRVTSCAFAPQITKKARRTEMANLDTGRASPPCQEISCDRMSGPSIRMKLSIFLASHPNSATYSRPPLLRTTLCETVSTGTFNQKLDSTQSRTV